jgi:hypothetical protein
LPNTKLIHADVDALLGNPILEYRTSPVAGWYRRVRAILREVDDGVVFTFTRPEPIDGGRTRLWFRFDPAYRTYATIIEEELSQLHPPPLDRQEDDRVSTTRAVRTRPGRRSHLDERYATPMALVQEYRACNNPKLSQADFAAILCTDVSTLYRYRKRHGIPWPPDQFQG